MGSFCSLRHFPYRSSFSTHPTNHHHHTVYHTVYHTTITQITIMSDKEREQRISFYMERGIELAVILGLAFIVGKYVQKDMAFHNHNSNTGDVFRDISVSDKKAFIDGIIKLGKNT